MADLEPFTLVEENVRPGPHHLFDDVRHFTSAKTADHDFQYLSSLRDANPGLIVTTIPTANIYLLGFAAAGNATFELDKDTDSFASWRGYVPPSLRSGHGQLGEQVHFAKYHYQWKGEDFILYAVGGVQYLLKERREGEHVLGPSHVTDELIKTVGDWQASDEEVVWVYDNYWTRSKALFQEIQKASWGKVILDESMKEELKDVAERFFDSQDVYEDLGVPWRRGLVFYGPPGNGKTISIKALMHTLLSRKESIPTLYVKSAPNSYHIRNVFTQARRLAPCMLVLEDIETIVTPNTRSYFFNEMDGLENNNGLFVVASTNFIEKLDPGLAKRPSRFDRKYLFPLPNEHERTLYCQYWRAKLASKPAIKFPEKLCPAMARITSQFSFAFLQELFIATLLILARDQIAGGFSNSDDELDKYVLWRVFKDQADVLRKEINGEVEGAGSASSQDAMMSSAAEAFGGMSVSPGEMNGRAELPQFATAGLLPRLPMYHRKGEIINSAAWATVPP